MSLNTNDGDVSEDLLNRSLSIRLEARGDLQQRKSKIGNPKLEFLPRNCDRIEAELRGMIYRWRRAGRPLDESAAYPMIHWARVIGGILEVSGFRDFLGNYSMVKVTDDPVREALGVLAGRRPDRALRPKEWAQLAKHEGLSKVLFSPADRDTLKGRERGIGVVFTKHLDETFTAMTKDKRITVRLRGGYLRWTPGGKPHTRYKFEVVKEEERPLDKLTYETYEENGSDATEDSVGMSSPIEESIQLPERELPGQAEEPAHPATAQTRRPAARSVSDGAARSTRQTSRSAKKSAGPRRGRGLRGTR